MQMTPSTLKQLEAELEQHFPEIEKTYGVKLSFGRGTYTPNNAKISLEIASIGEAGEVLSQEAEDFKLFAPSLGLKRDDLNRRFSTSHGTYTLRGYRRRASKNVILAEKVKTGKMFVLPLETVQRALSVRLGI
jgi:hypothetical protein